MISNKEIIVWLGKQDPTAEKLYMKLYKYMYTHTHPYTCAYTEKVLPERVDKWLTSDRFIYWVFFSPVVYI